MADRIHHAISKLIVGLAAAFPLGLAAVCAIPNFFGGWGLFWEGHPYSYYFLPDIVRHLPLGLPLAVGWIAFFVWFCRRPFWTDSPHLPLKIFLVTLVSRGVIALTLGQFAAPLSDFGFAWDRALTGVVSPCNNAHVFFPAWMNFSMFERIWVLLFGSNIGVGLMQGAILNSVMTVLLFYFALLVFEKREIALVASLLYAFYPSSCVYVLTPACEHFSNAFFMGTALLCARCMVGKMPNLKILSCGVIAGILAGLGASVKPVFPIYVIAMTICLGFALLRDLKWSRLVRSTLLVIAVVACESITVLIITRCTERMFDVSLRKWDPTPHFLCVGLNRQGEGQIHLGSLSRTWNRLVSQGESSEIAARTAYEVVKNDWLAHPDEVLPFFMKKFVWTWQDDNRPFGLMMLQLGKKFGDKVLDSDDKLIMAQVVQQRELGATNDAAPKPKRTAPTSRAEIMDYVWQSVQTAGFAVYAIVMLTAFCGVIWYEHRKPIGIPYLLTCLLITGFGFLFALGEASSRYKCLVMPYVFVVLSPFLSELVRFRSHNETSERGCDVSCEEEI